MGEPEKSSKHRAGNREQEQVKKWVEMKWFIEETFLEHLHNCALSPSPLPTPMRWAPLIFRLKSDGCSLKITLLEEILGAESGYGYPEIRPLYSGIIKKEVLPVPAKTPQREPAS